MKLAIKTLRKLAQSYSGRAPLPVREIARDHMKWLHSMHHRKLAREAISPVSLLELGDYVRDHPVPLSAPLVLISQVERSGGTLLSQLFDGHPQVAAYPHELRFGFLETDLWPAIDLSQSADDLFMSLIDLKMRKLAKRGFKKGATGEAKKFLLSPRVQHAIFCRQIEIDRPTSARHVFDYFFTGFFNAWLDYQGGPLDAKAHITAFAPRLADDADSVSRFFDCYPDGYLIQIIRSPETWLASAVRHRQTSRNDQSAAALLDAWKESVQAMLLNKKNYGARALIVSFDQLVNDTEKTMRKICDLIGLRYNACLNNPTLNGSVMWANSSFPVAAPGLSKDTARRRVLDAGSIKINTACRALYAAAATEVV